MSEAPFPDFLPPQLVTSAGNKRLARGEHLFRLGDPVVSIYFVMEGDIKAVRYQADGKESVMLRSGAGEFFAESAMMVERYVCDAVCLRDSVIAAFPALLFREQLQTNAAFAFAFAARMATNARRQCSRYERLRLGKARDRVLHLLSCEAGADGFYSLSGPLVELADELSVEPETLYRVLAELEKEGRISRSRHSLRLITPSGP